MFKLLADRRIASSRSARPLLAERDEGERLVLMLADEFKTRWPTLSLASSPTRRSMATD